MIGAGVTNRKNKGRSMFVKWIMIFTGLLIIAQLFTAALSVKLILPTFYQHYSEKLSSKANLLKMMYEQGYQITSDTLSITGDNDIEILLRDDESLSNDYKIYGDNISLNMVRQVMNGEIVSSHSGDFTGLGSFGVPFAMVALGDEIALLVPNAKRSDISVVVNVCRNILFISALIGSLLISGALRMFLRPIRKVTNAAQEVSKGNFEITLKSKSNDEVGRLIKSFNYMTSALQKNEYLKKDFVSSVSHEFKTPITSIEGFARLIKDEKLSENQLKEYADIIIRETQRLSRLSSNLLTLTMLENDTLEADSNEFYLDEQIRNVILLLENQWTEKDIDLNIEMDEILINSNEELLSQVWINLLQNAIKFSPSGGEITVNAEQTDETVKVTISDKGIGIAADSIDRVFERFYKADKSRNRNGNGLGLSIVKRILELTGGSISIESKEGRGTTVYVELTSHRPQNDGR